MRLRRFLKTRTRDLIPSQLPQPPLHLSANQALKLGQNSWLGGQGSHSLGMPVPQAHITLGFCVSQARTGVMTGLFTHVSTRLAQAMAMNVYETGKAVTSAGSCPAALEPFAFPQSLSGAIIQASEQHWCSQMLLVLLDHRPNTEPFYAVCPQCRSIMVQSALTRPKQTQHVVFPGKLLLTLKNPVQTSFLRASAPVPYILLP